MTNNIHLSNFYFDLNKRDTLSDDEKFIFSKLIGLANDLISRINNSNLDNSIKEKKFRYIKSKITDCHSLSLALEYYLDFELEVYKIDSKTDEYSNLEYTKSEDTNSDSSKKNTLTINTETKFISKTKDNDGNKPKDNNEKNNSIIELETKKVKNISFYVDKYNSKTNANKDYILDVISKIQ